MMSRSWLLVLLLLFPTSFTLTIDLENCTYSIDFYKEYLNLLWSSEDRRSLRIQAIYSLSTNQTRLSPGQISIYSSQSVALIPFVVQCQSYHNRIYLPFTQCSSAIVNKILQKNYESTRTNLYLKTFPTHINIPVLYLGEYSLILSNCSFQINQTIYRLKSNEIFSFQIEYESSHGSICTSCNRRTSICFNQTCQCRYGTIPIKFNKNHQQFCVDRTQHCTIDSQRCLYSKSIQGNYSKQLMIILIILIHFVLFALLIFLWFLYRSFRSKNLNEKHERTPSTISTIDSIHHEQYPKIVREEKNGDIIYILV